jgi:hypothetical protein
MINEKRARGGHLVLLAPLSVAKRPALKRAAHPTPGIGSRTDRIRCCEVDVIGKAWMDPGLRREIEDILIILLLIILSAVVAYFLAPWLIGVGAS